MKKMLIGFIATIMLVLLAGCGNTPDESAAAEEASEVAETTEVNETVEEVAVEDSVLTLGDTFEFDGLEITLGDTIGWTTVNNQFLDYYGADVFYFPITVTNNSDRTHGLHDVSRFGPDGLRKQYFDLLLDDDILQLGPMRSGATQEGYMYFVYEGDGDYFIEFSEFTNVIEVKISMEK